MSGHLDNKSQYGPGTRGGGPVYNGTQVQGNAPSLIRTPPPLRQLLAVGVCGLLTMLLTQSRSCNCCSPCSTSSFSQGLSAQLPWGFDYDPEAVPANSLLDSIKSPKGAIMHVWSHGWFV